MTTNKVDEKAYLPDDGLSPIGELDTSNNDQLVTAIDKQIATGDAQMRSSRDNLSIPKAFRLYWRMSLVCTAAAFCAALDGYQVLLAGSIVSNKGFIERMSGPGVKVINATYISVWGGMLSTGQFIGVAALSFAMDPLGRKVSMHLTWLTLAISVALESAAKNWIYWLFAKLLSGAGLGMMQATYPLYISEHAPTQLRGFLINTYLFWYVLAQIFASLALRQLKMVNPLDYKTPIYTQWGMLGVLLLINIFLPESPWWLVQRGKYDQAEKVLARTHKGIAGFDARSDLSIMIATVEKERLVSEANKENKLIEYFKGTNGLRTFIAFWPKAIQQFCGQSLSQTYVTYFFQLAGNTAPFTVTLITSSCKLAGCIAAALVSDTLGRRWLILGMFGAGALAALGMGILGSFDYETPQLGGLLIFFACVSNFGVEGGAGMAYSYVAEIPTQRLRARTVSIALCGSFLLGICFSYTVPLMLNGKAQWKLRTGYFFAAVGLLSCLVGYFTLPEIARRTPAEIDEMFEEKVSLRKYSTYVTRVQKNLEEKENMERGVAPERQQAEA